MEATETAIMHAGRAGKLRAYVRRNGSGLAGLMRLADKESAASRAALTKWAEDVGTETDALLTRGELGSCARVFRGE